MLDIFICEDNQVQRNMIETTIANYLLMEQLDMRITLSSENPHVILEYVKEKQVSKGVYFLDVELETDITGIDLALELRKVDKRGSIVFITSKPYYMPLTFEYGVEALGYVTKGNAEILKEKLIQNLKLAWNRLALDETGENHFNYRSEGRVISQKYEDILFFETSRNAEKKVTLHANSRQIDFFGKLSEIEEMSKFFFRCHRSYVVNLPNIQEIDKKTGLILMKDGSQVFAATRKVKELITVWSNQLS